MYKNHYLYERKTKYKILTNKFTVKFLRVGAISFGN